MGVIMRRQFMLGMLMIMKIPRGLVCLLRVAAMLVIVGVRMGVHV